MIKVRNRNHGKRWETIAPITLDIVEIILEINWGIANLKQKSKKKKEKRTVGNQTIIPLPGSDRT